MDGYEECKYIFLGFILFPFLFFLSLLILKLRKNATKPAGITNQSEGI